MEILEEWEVQLKVGDRTVDLQLGDLSEERSFEKIFEENLADDMSEEE